MCKVYKEKESTEPAFKEVSVVEEQNRRKAAYDRAGILDEADEVQFPAPPFACYRTFVKFLNSLDPQFPKSVKWR